MSSPARYAFYVWEVPEKSVSIHLHFHVIDAIHQEVMKGFGAIPRRGAEVGGLLLGRSESEDKRTIYIEEYEPLACEYFHGPSFRLSDKDRSALEAALSRWRPGPDRWVWAVGFYRSHTRQDLSLSDDDLTLCSKYFSDPGDVFLLIKPFASRTARAGFFFWESGHIRSHASYLEFPFHRRELGGAETETVLSQLAPAQPVDGPLAETPAAGNSAGEHTTGAAFRTRAGFSPRARRLWLPLLGVVFLIAGFLVWQILKRESLATIQKAQQIGPMAYPIGLRVAENQHELHVSWDRNSPAVVNADRATLTIIDGAYRRDLDFNSTQVRNGSLVYWRMTPDVSFELKLFNKQGASASETVRAFRAEPAQSIPATPAPVPAASDAVSPPRLKQRSPRASSRRQVSKPPAPTQPQEAVPELPELERPPRRR